jgi:hypothetical protein
MSRLSFVDPLSILKGDATWNGVRSTGLEKMGDGLAYFKTRQNGSIVGDR